MLTEEQLHEIQQLALAAQQRPPGEQFLVFPAERVLDLLATVRDAVQQERAACARVAEKATAQHKRHEPVFDAGWRCCRERIAATIRQRGASHAQPQ